MFRKTTTKVETFFELTKIKQENFSKKIKVFQNKKLSR